MFRIKICGITSIDDALATARAGADAVGLNFYRRSPRCVAADAARAIIEALPAGIVKVGVFVDTPAGDVCRLFDDLRLDLIQLHGDQPPEFLTQLGGRPVMRAFRVEPEGSRTFTEHLKLHMDLYQLHGDQPREPLVQSGNRPGKRAFSIASEGLRPVTEYLGRCRDLAVLPTMVLIDSLVLGEYGGTGKVADWNVAQRYTKADGLPPLVLAGGLTPENVAAAIRAVGPAAVDVASGVESRPGYKKPTVVTAFVKAALAAFST
jgi:phosphoribosylanthranilate isomerase